MQNRPSTTIMDCTSLVDHENCPYGSCKMRCIGPCMYIARFLGPRPCIRLLGRTSLGHACYGQRALRAVCTCRYAWAWAKSGSTMSMLWVFCGVHELDEFLLYRIKVPSLATSTLTRYSASTWLVPMPWGKRLILIDGQIWESSQAFCL